MRSELKLAGPLALARAEALGVFAESRYNLRRNDDAPELARANAVVVFHILLLVCGRVLSTE